MLMTQRLVLLLTGVLWLGAAAAQEEAGRLNVQTVVEKARLVVADDGSERTELSAVATAVPGDELIYTVVFTNISTETADNVRVTNPIPGELRLVQDSAFGPGTAISFSIDDGASFAAADELLVQLAEGESRPATPDDYTHIRWTLKNPLEAGARGFARYRAVVR